MPRYPKITPPLLPMPRTVRWHRADVQLPSPLILWIQPEEVYVLDEILQHFICQIETQLGVVVKINCQLEQPVGYHVALQASASRLRHVQGYRLKISEESIQIEAKSSVGIAFGMQTLLQTLLFSGRTVPTCYITDWPDLDVRGISLSLYDGSIPKTETLEQIIDVLSALKLNCLNLFCMDQVAQTQIEDGQKLRWKQYGENRMVELIWHCDSVSTETSNATDGLSTTVPSHWTGRGPITEEQFKEWLAKIEVAEQSQDLYCLQPMSEFLPTLIFMLYPLATVASKLWCPESNADQDGHAWLDWIYFREHSGSAAALCNDLAQVFLEHNSEQSRVLEARLIQRVFENQSSKIEPTSQELDIVSSWKEVIVREQTQLDYLEFQGPEGKWFLTELQLTCDLLLSAIALFETDQQTNSKNEMMQIEQQRRKVVNQFREYRLRRYEPAADAFYRKSK